MNKKTIAGVWKGFYSYGSPDNLFDFTLVIELVNGNSVVGTILENGHDKPLEIAGVLNSPMLRFSKVATNKQSVRYFEPFDFEGYLSSDCLHISGFWTNASARGDWSLDKEEVSVDTMGDAQTRSEVTPELVPVDAPVESFVPPEEDDTSSVRLPEETISVDGGARRLPFMIDPVGDGFDDPKSSPVERGSESASEVDSSQDLGAGAAQSKRERQSASIDEEEGVPWSLLPGPVKGELRPGGFNDVTESAETDRATSEGVLQRLLSIQAKNSAYKVDPVGNEIQLLNEMRIEPQLANGPAARAPQMANVPEAPPLDKQASSSSRSLSQPSQKAETQQPALIAPIVPAQEVSSPASVPAPPRGHLHPSSPESRCPRCGAERGGFSFCIACGHSFDLSS